MDKYTDNLARARQAHAAQDWANAAACFDGVPTDQLTADDLAAHADAMSWLGRIEDTLRLTAAACEAFEADARPAEAGWAAMRLGLFHMGRGDKPQAMGWLGRTGRLLEGIPDCPAQGLLLLVTGVEASLQAGKPTAAVEAARQVQALGRRIDEPGLVLMGLNSEGRALIMAGQMADGLALLDEAMVTAIDLSLIHI